mgnify:CR=1 FL=1
MRALYASSGRHAPLGDPELEAPRRFPCLHGTGLPFPLMSWLVDGAELEAADALEAFLSGSAAPDELARDVELGRVLMSVLRSGGGPAQMLLEVQSLADARAVPELVPVTVDRADPLATVALDITSGADDETAAVRLLSGDETARALLTFIAQRIPPAMRHKLAPQARAAAARDVLDVRLLRAASLELVVDLSLREDEAREARELERPHREAAARLHHAAAESRRRLAAELDACAAEIDGAR